MGEKMEFVRNYSDLSNNRGFQFEFTCDRCRSGFRTPFKASVTGTVTEVLGAASSLFGGIFGSAANASDHLRSASWQQAKDDAFLEAVRDIRPDFIQCPHCSSWVCRKNCWNTKKGLCKDCAPDLGVEMSAAQSSKSVEEIWAHACMAEEDKKLDEQSWRQTIRATCPQCEAPLATNAKFCPECGAKLKSNDSCAKCGMKLTPNAKFCPECGEKV